MGPCLRRGDDTGKHRVKIPIRNKSDQSLGIMIEPWTDTVEIAPGQEAEVTCKIGADDEIVLDFGSENFLSLWVPPGTTIKIRSEGH